MRRSSYWERKPVKIRQHYSERSQWEITGYLHWLNCRGLYSRAMSKPSGLRLETKQLDRVPAFGPSTRRTIARADESNSAPTFSTWTRWPSGVMQNWPTMLAGDSFSVVFAISMVFTIR